MDKTDKIKEFPNKTAKSVRKKLYSLPLVIEQKRQKCSVSHKNGLKSASFSNYKKTDISLLGISNFFSGV